MKRTIFLFFLFALFSNTIVLAIDVPLNPAHPKDPIPYPRSPDQNRSTVATATLNNPELVLNFNTAVGSAIITVTDETGYVVYQGVLNTDATSSLSIPVDSYDSGTYTLDIQYSDIELYGTFQL
jgi:hypothetical protein